MGVFCVFVELYNRDETKEGKILKKGEGNMERKRMSLRRKKSLHSEEHPVTVAAFRNTTKDTSCRMNR
jgi:hypothetical protein